MVRMAEIENFPEIRNFGGKKQKAASKWSFEAAFTSVFVILDLAFASGIRQTEILSPNGNDVISRFSETFAANEWCFTHRNRSKRGFHVVATNRTFLNCFG